MSLPLTINGATFEYPQDFDTEWGIDATGWAQAVTNGMLQKSGGNFFLTNTVNFGPSFGIKLLSVTTETTNAASTGQFRLAKTDSIAWRDNANSRDLILTIDGSDMLEFDGSVLGLTTLTHNQIYVGNVSNLPASVAMSGDATIVASGALTIANGAVTNAKITAAAGISVNKLAAQTASRAIVSDGSGFIAPSATTATEIGFVSGVTSSIQTQINSISATTVPAGAMMDFAGTAAPSGWLLCDGSSYATASQPTLFAAIGYAWGGAGANFNVPNMTRRVGMGSGGSGTGVIGNAVGNTGGAETVTLTAAQIPASLTVSDPGHTHTQTGNVGGTFNTAGGGNPCMAQSQTSSVSTSTTGITVGGGGLGHDNIQPAAIVLKIIKT